MQQDLPQKEPTDAHPLPLSCSPAQQEIPQKEPHHHPSLYRAAPCSGSSPCKSLLISSNRQPRAVAGAPAPVRASFLPLPSSPAQREIPRKNSRKSLIPPPPSSPPVQPARELPKKESPPYLNRAAPRSGRSLRHSLLPSNGQPHHAAGAPPERASFRPALTGSAPRQRELSQKEPPPSLDREQPRAAGGPPERVSSLPQSSSPAQREPPQKEPLPSL